MLQVSDWKAAPVPWLCTRLQDVAGVALNFGSISRTTLYDLRSHRSSRIIWEKRSEKRRCLCH